MSQRYMRTEIGVPTASLRRIDPGTAFASSRAKAHGPELGEGVLTVSCGRLNSASDEPNICWELSRSPSK